MFSVDYNGFDSIQVGKGQGMSISCVGHSYLHSHISNTSFHLTKLMHVPGLTKYFISVSKFVKDNQVFFEFHPNECLVKSQDTKEIVL